MNVTRLARRLPALLVLALLAAGAQAASAATICVQDPACPASAETQPTIAAALSAAGNDGSHPGPDRIQLGPVTFSEAGLVDGPGNEVDIVGSGIANTTIAAPAANSATTLLLWEPASSVSDLSLRLPEGTNETGLALNGTARGVAVKAFADTTGTGVQLLSSTALFSLGSVVLPTSAGTTGVGSQMGGGRLADTTVTAATGVSGLSKVQRVHVTATVEGVQTVSTFSGLAATVDDVLVQLVGTGTATGLSSDAFAILGGASTSLTARHVTVIGNGNPGSIGVAVTASSGIMPGSSASASATLSGAILRELGIDLKRSVATATANLTIDYSDYDPLKRSDLVGGGTIAEGSHSLDVDPGFRDPTSGDFALRANSPLIDHGNPATPAAGESATDVVGNPRVVDGNGDGNAISDMGAFEYQPPPPPVPPAPPGGAPPPATPAALRPVLSALSLTYTRFAVGADRTAKAAKRRHAKRAPRGTTIQLTLSRAATVKLTIQRPAAGRRSDKACVKPTRKLRKAKRCTRYVAVFSFSRHGTSGKNAIAFSGRVGRRGRTALPLGPYRFLASATADRLASTPRSERFTIVKR